MKLEDLIVGKQYKMVISDEDVIYCGIGDYNPVFELINDPNKNFGVRNIRPTGWASVGNDTYYTYPGIENYVTLNVMIDRDNKLNELGII